MIFLKKLIKYFQKIYGKGIFKQNPLSHIRGLHIKRQTDNETHKGGLSNEKENKIERYLLVKFPENMILNHKFL